MMISELADVMLPKMLELDMYRRFNPDVAALSDPELIEHYMLRGEREGRRSNVLGSRGDFIALIPPGAETLEIGPLNAPALSGERVRYFDVNTRADLIERAKKMGLPSERTPQIDYVSPVGDLSIVDRVFDAVFSSHCIEHQPDLIAHLRSVERLLHEGGRYFLIIPDQRYCFDHFMSPSLLADVLEAYHEQRTKHTLGHVLSTGAFSAHNDCARHWAGDHGAYLENFRERYQRALGEYRDLVDETYIDAHAWFFTPASFKTIVLALQVLGLTSFEIERIYPTRFNANEFWVVLRKRSVAAAP